MFSQVSIILFGGEGVPSALPYSPGQVVRTPALSHPTSCFPGQVGGGSTPPLPPFQGQVGDLPPPPKDQARRTSLEGGIGTGGRNLYCLVILI